MEKLGLSTYSILANVSVQTKINKQQQNEKQTKMMCVLN